MGATRARSTVPALALLLSISASALAAPDEAEGTEPEKDPGAEAVQLGRAALDSYGRAEWQVAYLQFSAAERLAHSPVFVLYLARCRRNGGHLLEARELFRAVTSEQLSEGAPLPWAQAAATAHAELGTLQQNIPSILLQKRPQSTLRLALIGARSLELSEAGSEVELDPGEHVIDVVAADGRHSSLRIQLREGRRRIPVLLPLEDTVPSTTTTTTTTAATAPRTPIATSKIVGYTALGLGAVGVVTGIVSGLVALQRTNELKRASCDEAGNCYPESRSEADVASGWATVSTVSFVVGGSALLAGTGVLLFAPSAGAPRANVVVRGVF